MTDIRCPMCSKPNPADAATCAFCGARITPLGAAGTPSDSSDTPDWLRDLRRDDDDPSTPAPSDAGGDVPDWLASIRDSGQKPAPQEPDAAASDWLSDLSGTADAVPAAGETEPDWLNSLQDSQPETAPEPPPPAATPTADSDMPDWLRALQGDQPAQAVEPTPPPTSAGNGSDADWLQGQTWYPTQASEPTVQVPRPPADDNNDWLAGLQSSAAAPAEQPAAPASDQDWLKDLETWTPQSAGAAESVQAQEFAPSAASPSETPDWLSNLPSEEPLRAEASPLTPDETPDWLSGLPSEEPLRAEASPLTPDETPDWLSGLPSEEPLRAEASPLTPDETPDWLSGLPSEEPLRAEASPLTPDETPDWLSGLPAEESFRAEASPLTPAETPDWLSGLPAEEPLRAEASPLTPDETPDWLSGLPAEESFRAEATPLTPDETPDWLSGLPSEEPLRAEAAPLTPDETPDWLSSLPAQEAAAAQPSFGTEEDTPDWLKAFAEPAGAVPDQQASAAFPAEDMAEWLAPEGAETSGSTNSPFVGAAGLGQGWEEDEQIQPTPVTPAFSFDMQPTGQTPEEELPFSDQELPDWLPAGEQEQAAPAAAFEGGIPDDLAPAELPSWVSAMRPVELAAPIPTPTLDDQQVERMGPLAGVKGVLPGQEAVIQYLKPAVYSVKLQVTDRQRIHSNLLEGMLTEENQPRTIAHELTNKSARWFRLITALILIGAILIPIIFGGANNLPTSLAAPGSPAEKLYNQINALSGGPVLLIIDYEPGLSAEMHIAARGVIQHLMEKSTFMALVSSSPTGPILAEQLLLEAYSINDTSVNLGYVPGGTTALQALVSDLRGTLRQPLRGSWDAPSLQAVNRLADFKQVILVTGSDDSARAWIEQIQPALGSTPLLVISSSQAAPMLQPYVDSGQIQTLLSGLMGGAAYQQLYQSPEPHDNSYWIAYFNAYQTGFAVAIAMIVVGLLLQIMLTVLNRTKKRKGA